MANIRSAKKRILTNSRRQMRNKTIRSATRTAIKKAVAAAGEKDVLALRKAIKAIDQAAAKGIFHKNTASRKKSKLAKLFNA